VLKGCELECELHGAVFDVRTGEAVALPARWPIRTFPVDQQGDRVRVTLKR
jgi:nitrite reductase/ring-hydroxylating ferredoxin subunit